MAGGGDVREAPPRSGQRSPNLKQGSMKFRPTACLCLSAPPMTSSRQRVRPQSLTEGRESQAP